jgi:hypothetical protein
MSAILASVVSLLLTGATGNHAPLPKRGDVARALIFAMSCQDEDGFTNCDVPVPVKIDFDHLRCSWETSPLESVGPYVTCEFTGRAMWRDHYGGGAARWRPLSENGRFIDLDLRPGPFRWQPSGGVYLGKTEK